MMSDCIFCKIATRVIPAKIISETPSSVAFLDAFPLAKGHVLVIPKEHYDRVQDIPDKESVDLFETAKKTIAKVDKISGATLMAIHNGRASGQEIPHVHIHLVPRDSTDGAGPIHSMFTKKPEITDEEMSSIHDKLKT